MQIIHYLDDFLLVLPPGPNLPHYSTKFSTLWEEVGLSIKGCKNEEGSIASYTGVELDTSRMVIRLPTKKLQKVRCLVLSSIARKSVSLRDLQEITGYLNFVSTVGPIGRTFLRRLYNMELYFPAGSHHQRGRLSREAQKDLAWWDEVLTEAPERSINPQVRNTISALPDASSTKGL